MPGPGRWSLVRGCAVVSLGACGLVGLQACATERGGAEIKDGGGGGGGGGWELTQTTSEHATEH
jgi:hypothetical protein